MSSSYNILALSSVSALPPKGKGERPEPAVSPGVKIEAGKNDYDHKKFVEAKLQELGVNISGTSIGIPEIDAVYSAMAEINVKGELADKVLKLILQNISSHGFLYEIKHPQSPEEYSALLTYAMMLRKMGLELSFDPGAPLTGEALNKLISDMKTVVKMFKIDKGIGSPDDGLFTGDVQAAIIKEFKISYLDVVQKITGELSDDLFYITLGSKEKPGYIGRVTAKDQLNETIFNPRDDLLFTTLTVISSLPDVKIGKGGVYDSGTVKELFRKYLEVVYIGENDKNFRGLISKYSSPRQDAGDLSRLYKYFNEKIKGMPLEVDELGSKEPVETYVESIFNGKGTDEALKRIDSFLEALAKIHDSIYSSEISQGKKALKEREDIKEILKLSVGKAKYTKLLKMLMQVYSQEIADRLSKSFVVDDLKREFGPFIKLYAEISGDESIGKRYEEIEGKQGKEYVAEVEKLLNEIGNGYQQKLGQKKYDEIHEMAKRLIEKQVLIDNSSTDIGRYRIFLGLLENDKLKYEPLSDKYYGKIGVAKRTPIVLNIEPGIPVDVYVVDIEHSQDDPVFKEIAELFVDGKYVNRDDVKKEGASSIVFNVMNNPSFGGNLTGQALAVIYRETENRDIQIAEMIENGKQLDLRADAFSGYVAESGVEASVKRYVAMREALDLVGLKDMSVSEAYEKLEEAYSDGKIRILTYIDDKSSTPVTKAGFLSLDPIDPDNGGKVLHGHDDPLDVKILRGLLMYKYGARSLEWDVLKDNKIASTFVNSFSAFQNDQGMFNTDSLALDIVFEILDKYSGINKDVLTLACKYSLDTIQEILNSMSQTSSFKLTDDFKKEIIESTKMRIREAENSAGLSDIGKLIKGNLSEIEGIISIVVDQIIISLQLNSGEKLDRQFIVETIGPIIQDAVNKIIPYSNAIKKSGDLEKDNLAITHDLVNNLISKCAESTVREGNRIEGKYTQIDLPVDSTTTQPADLVGKKEKTSIEITSDTDMHELAWENRNFVLKLYLKEFGSRPISKVDGKYYAETDIMAEDLDAFIKFKAGKIEKGKTRANPVEIALIQKVKGYVNSGKVVITDIFKNIPGNSDVASETNEVLKILRDFYEDVLRRIVISNSDKEMLRKQEQMFKEEDGIGVKTPFLDRILGKEGFTGKVKDIGLSFLRLPASPDLKAQDIVDDATIIALKEVLFAGEVELIRKGIITSGNPRYKYLLNAAIDRDFIERFVKMFPGLLYHPLFMVIFGSYAEKFKIESDEGNPKKVKDPCAFLLEVAQKMDVPWESLHLNANDLLHREEFVAKALIQAALNFYRPGMRSAPKGIGGKLNSELKAITSFADLLIYDKLHYPLARVIKGTLLKEKYVDWANTDDSLTVHNVSLLDDKIDRAILKKCAQLFLKYLEFYKSDEEKANLIRTFERMGYSFKSEGLEERWKEITHWADVLEKAANDKSFKEFELTYNDYEGWNDDIVNALKVFARIVAPEFSAQSEGEEPTLDIGFTLRNYVGFKEGTEIEFRSEKEIVRGIASQDNAPLVTSVPVKEDATKTPVEAAGEDFFSQYVLFKFLMAPQIQIQMQWGLSVQVSNMLYAGQKGDPFAANDIYDSVTMWLETRASFLAFSYNPGAWLRGISDLWNQGNKYGAAANALIMVPFGMGAGMALLNVAAANYARATNRVLFRSGGNTTITGAVKKSFVENELAPLEGEKPGITAWYKAARGAAKTYRFLPWLKDNALLNPFLAIKKGGRKTVVPLAKIVGEKVNEKVPVGGLITKAETKVLKNRKYQTNRSDFEKSGEPASKLKIDPLNPQGEYTFLLENSKSGRFTARVFESPLKAFNYVIGKGLRTFVVSHILGLFQVRPLQYERFGSKSITISAPDLLRIVSGEIDEVFKALGLKLTAQEKQVLVEEIGKLWRANGGDKISKDQIKEAMKKGDEFFKKSQERFSQMLERAADSPADFVGIEVEDSGMFEGPIKLRLRGIDLLRLIRIQIDPSKVDVSLQGGPVNEAMIKESLVSILRSNPLFIDVFRGAVYSSADQSGDKGEELKSQFEIFAQALNEINEGAREIAKEEMGRRGLPISDEHIERFLSISEDCYSKTEHIFARENLEIFRAYMDTRNRLTGENGLLRSFMSELVIQRYMQLFKSSFIDKFTLMHEFIEKIRGLYRRGHENYLIEKRFVQEKLKPESVKISIEKRAEHIYEAIFSDKGETARKIEIFSNNGLHGLENRNVSGDFLAKLRDVGFNRIIINLPEAENARLNFDELSEHFRDLKAEGKIKINGCLVMSKDNGSIQYRQFELGSWNIRSDNGSFILVDGEGKPISDKAGSIKGTPLEVLKRGEEWTKVRPGTVGGAAIDFPGVRETPAPAEELRLIRLENIRSVLGDVYGDKLAEKIVSEIENPNFERIAEIEGKLRESLGRMTNEEFAKLIGEKNIKKAAEIKTKLNRYILKQGGIGLASMTFGFVGMIGLSTLLHHIDPEMNQSLHTAIVLLGGHFTNEGIMALINSYKKKGFIETLRVLKSPVRPGKILRAVGRDFYTVEKAAKQGKNVRQILRTPAKLLGGMGRGNISAAGWRAAMDTLGVSKNSKLRAYGEMGAFFAPDVIGLGNTVLDRVIGFKFLSNIGKKGIIKAGGKALGIVGAVAFTADLTVGGIEYLTVKDPYMRFVMGRAKEAWKKDQAGVFAKYGLIAGDALVGSFVDSMIPDKYLDLIEKEDGKGISDMLEDFGVGLLASILYVFGLELSIEGRLSASMLPEEAKEAFKEHIITYLTQGDGKGAEYFAYMQYVIRLKYGENIPKELKAITELNIEDINNIELSDAFIDAILNVGTVDGKGLMGQIKKLSLKPLTRGHSV